MTAWHSILVSPQTSIRDALQKIDSSQLQIALVVDGQQRLLGTVTDGDVRRALLKGIALEQPVDLVMNPRPITARRGQDRESVLALMQNGLHQIPVVDEHGVITGIEVIEKLIRKAGHENWVILMAGGLGTRLRPLTENCPKPMLRIGGKPILENILNGFIEHGFRNFFISVNYMGDKIKQHFQDGSAWGAHIRYIDEPERMGTAGALARLAEKPDQPVIVMNGDLVTKVNFNQLLDFHHKHEADATMCVREFDFQIPYGVVNLDEHHITGLDEKPVQRMYVNAGIYVLSPSAIAQIPADTFFDMTDLFQKLVERQANVAAFPIREYWLDIGQPADLERAISESAL